MIDEIRAMKHQDVEPLRAFFLTASEYVSARTISDYWLYSRLFSNTCIVATSGSTIIGAALGFLNQGDGDDLYLQDLAVSKNFRHQDIGFSLMQDIIKRATALNATSIWLTSKVENVAALALWNKLGFINPKADYQQGRFWVSKDFKAPGMDRVIFQLTM